MPRLRRLSTCLYCCGWLFAWHGRLLAQLLLLAEAARPLGCWPPPAPLTLLVECWLEALVLLLARSLPLLLRPLAYCLLCLQPLVVVMPPYSVPLPSDLPLPLLALVMPTETTSDTGHHSMLIFSSPVLSLLQVAAD